MVSEGHRGNAKNGSSKRRCQRPLRSCRRAVLNGSYRRPKPPAPGSMITTHRSRCLKDVLKLSAQLRMQLNAIFERQNKGATATRPLSDNGQPTHGDVPFRHATWWQNPGDRQRVSRSTRPCTGLLRETTSSYTRTGDQAQEADV